MVDLFELISLLLRELTTLPQGNTREKGSLAVRFLVCRMEFELMIDDDSYSRGGGYGRDRYDDRRPYDGGRDRYDDRDRERLVLYSKSIIWLTRQGTKARS